MKSDVEKISDAVGTQSIPSLFLRAMLVVSFAFIGAAVASSSLNGLRSAQFPTDLVPRLQIPAWVLLGAVSIQSLLLGHRGKTSESWAVMAFGSLCCAAITFLVAVVWYESDIIRERWGGILFLAAATIALIIFGMHAAFRGRWGEMFLSSLPMLFLVIIYGVCINYAQHFYCRRNHIPYVKPSAPIVPPAYTAR